MNRASIFLILKSLVVALLIVFALIPLMSMLINGYNSLYLDSDAILATDKLGQLGDFFGGHTAAFAGLSSTALILYFSTKQLTVQQLQFTKQMELSKQTADLTSIGNIYQHYGESYGKDWDAGNILRSIAEGHRRWAIRESFSFVDPEGVLESHRKLQVSKDFDSLRCLLHQESVSEGEIRRISVLTASLLLDRRLCKDRRAELWSLYELLRVSPLELITAGSEARKVFEQVRKELVLGEVAEQPHDEDIKACERKFPFLCRARCAKLKGSRDAKPYVSL